MTIENPCDVSGCLCIGYQSPGSAIWRSPNFQGMPESSRSLVFGKATWNYVYAMKTNMLSFRYRICFYVCALSKVHLRYRLMQVCEQILVQL